MAVNGLVIGGDVGVKNYYTSNVLTTGGKLYEANDFADFGATIREKIFAEVGGEVPEPSTWAMLVTGLATLAFSARRRRV